MSLSVSLYTPLYSFPMKENFPVQTPEPGIYLSCVTASACRDSTYVKGSHLARPVIYGRPELPPGFLQSNTLQCPEPRGQTFQTLEEFWSQDFLQTFTDCLKYSDYHTRGAKAMGFSVSQIFEGSAVDLLGARVTQSLLGVTQEYDYECCMHPSFYIANVRGLTTTTPYYNPLFTTVHDYNCFEKNGCIAYGSVKNVEGDEIYDFPKASPRSVMWYLQHSVANVDLDGLGTTQPFGVGGVPGTPGSVGSNDLLFRSIRSAVGATDTPSQRAARSYGQFSCPTAPVDESSDISLFSIFSLQYPPSNWKEILLTLSSQNRISIPNEVNCCTRGIVNSAEGGKGTVSDTLSGLLINSFNQGLALGSSNMSNPSYATVTPSTYSCPNYSCFESPYCQSLLTYICTSFSAQIGGQNYDGNCTAWRNWASNNYTSINPFQANRAGMYPTNNSVLDKPASFNAAASEYPVGAYSSSVDQSVFTLLQSCQLALGNLGSQSNLLGDQCNGLLSLTSFQTKFPRLRGLTFDSGVQYSTRPVQPFTVDSSNNRIDIVLTYTQYRYSQQEADLNKFFFGPSQGSTYKFFDYTPLLNPSGGGVFLNVPQIENQFTYTVFLDNLVAGDSVTFYNKVRTNFNLKVQEVNGKFPMPATGNFVSEFQAPLPNPVTGLYPIFRGWPSYYSDRVVIETIKPAFVNHSTNQLTWSDSGIQIIHNVVNLNADQYGTVNNNDTDDVTAFRNFAHREENVNYLYTPTIRFNSVLDKYPISVIDGNTKQFQAWLKYFTTNFLGITVENDAPAGYDHVYGVFDQDMNRVDVTDPVQLERADNRYTFYFNQNLADLLGMTQPSLSVNINPLKGGSLNFNNNIPYTTGTLTTFSVTLPIAPPLTPPSIIDVISEATFVLTNTTPITIQSLSVLNYSNAQFPVTVALSTQTLAPNDSVTVTVDSSASPENSGSLTANPMLLYDAYQGWQNNLSSPDYPILGGFTAGLAINFFQHVPYANNRFSSFVTDSELELGEDFQGTVSTILTYYANQNVYSAGEANAAGNVSELFLSPLV